jgi:hypothetical protein
MKDNELRAILLADAEVMQEFDDCVWVKIPLDVWEEIANPQGEDDEYKPLEER